MASACVNNISVSPESFPPPGTYSSYGWLSPRISFSREDDSSSKHHHHHHHSQPSPPSSKAAPAPAPPPPPAAAEVEKQHEQQDLLPDFEFRLDDPVAMLPADELFSDGKLVPMQVASSKPWSSLSSSTTTAECLAGIATAAEKSGRRMEMELPGGINSTAEQYLFSPKAPRCSSRWKEILGLRKFYQNNSSKAASFPSSSSSFSSSSSSNNNNQKSLRHFLHRSSKSCNSCSHSSSASLDGALSLPLLKGDLECESVSLSSSRLSLSSSSSSHEHEDLPRLSLDSEKPNAASNLSLTFNPLQSPNPFVLNRNQNPPRMRMVKPRAAEIGGETTAASRVGRSPMRRATAAGAGAESGGGSRGVSVDSPRLNSSGKIVFQSLERSSSSPSSFNGGPRHKHRGMERSYSANVRVTPVLNVPVCSLMGSSKSGSVFGFFSSSPQKRDGNSSVNYNSKGQLSFGSHNSSRGNRAMTEQHKVHPHHHRRDGVTP